MLRRAVYAHRVVAILAAFWNCRETRDSAKRASWASSCCTRSRSSSPRTWGGQARSQASKWGAGCRERSRGNGLLLGCDPVVIHSGLGKASTTHSPRNGRVSVRTTGLLCLQTLSGASGVWHSCHLSHSGRYRELCGWLPSGKSFKVPHPDDESSTFLTRTPKPAEACLESLVCSSVTPMCAPGSPPFQAILGRPTHHACGPTDRAPHCG